MNALREEIQRAVPKARFVTADDADVVIQFDGNVATACVDCGENWTPGLFPVRYAYAFVDRSSPAECAAPLARLSWSGEAYSVRGNARAFVKLLLPHLINPADC